METNVSVSEWTACINVMDGTLAVSCTVEANDVTSVGLIVNTAAGKTVATAYTTLSGGCNSASPAINVAASGIAEGDTLNLAADGQAGGEHFFYEEKVTVGKCES